MTPEQGELIKTLLLENKKLGAQLDVAISALQQCQSNSFVEHIANKALLQIIRIGEGS